jgi:hypothetical protein
LEKTKLQSKQQLDAKDADLKYYADQAASMKVYVQKEQETLA